MMFSETPLVRAKARNEILAKCVFGAMAVAGIWSVIFPGLREQRSLDKKMA